MQAHAETLAVLQQSQKSPDTSVNNRGTSGGGPKGGGGGEP